MSTLCIQVQPNRATGINMERVRTLSETIAANKELVTRFAVVEGEDDGSFSNLVFETHHLKELWESLWDTLYKDENVGSALSQASMAMCEGSDGWNDYLVLYHFDPTIKRDKFEAQRSLVVGTMMEHDPRCEGLDDEKLLADIANYGWHVVKIFAKEDTPGWAFSIGLYKNFNHPEIVVFGLNDDLMHSVINSIGEDVRVGKHFVIDGLYPDLIEAYSCTFKPVNPVWYYHFFGYANWFYKGQDYPVLQCIWPDKNSRYPWEIDFNPNWVWAQPLLFNEEPVSARTTQLLQSME